MHCINQVSELAREWFDAHFRTAASAALAHGARLQPTPAGTTLGAPSGGATGAPSGATTGAGGIGGISGGGPLAKGAGMTHVGAGAETGATGAEGGGLLGKHAQRPATIAGPPAGSI